MNDIASRSSGNQLLAALSNSERERILPLFERTEFGRGQILYRAGEPISYVYFPTHSLVSVVANTEDGQSAEVAVIGREGATGLDVVMGADSTQNEHITELPVEALRIKTSDVRIEFDRCGDFQAVLLDFTRKLMVQISQTALCNRLHTTEKRLSRWLLMCHDRADSDVLNLTQEFMSVMLGANRTTVTMTAIELQNLGFISYSRGSLTVVDRRGLEAFTCPCYQTIKQAYTPSGNKR